MKVFAAGILLFASVAVSFPGPRAQVVPPSNPLQRVELVVTRKNGAKQPMTINFETSEKRLDGSAAIPAPRKASDISKISFQQQILVTGASCTVTAKGGIQVGKKLTVGKSDTFSTPQPSVVTCTAQPA